MNRKLLIPLLILFPFLVSCMATKDIEYSSEEVVRDALKTEKPVVFSKSYVEDRTGVADTLKLLRIESVMCLPLIGGAGAVGAMYLDSLKRPDGFRRDDLLDLLDIAQRIAVAVESERFAADMSEVARSLGSLK